MRKSDTKNSGKQARASRCDEPRLLRQVKEDLGECTRCPLHENRKTIVFGDGNPATRIMFIGEGPGADEDEQGLPFIGRAGQLLTEIMVSVGLERGEAYITNVVKCRPPGNRNPKAVEMAACRPFLDAQIEAIAPGVIVALGRVATGNLLGSKEALSRLRGKFHAVHGVPVMPTYHPSFLLRYGRNESRMSEAQADLRLAMNRIGL
ncbi:uracil-DNA glycosylase [Thermodesulfobacteriota bacterium]